jgi:protein-S-isoprenylcysteine O-methyltransferase Ste14
MAGMSFHLLERVLQWAGAAALAAFLALVFVGMARALRRPRGRATGLAARTLRWPVYLLIGIPFFAVAIFLWRPLPLALSPSLQALALAFGALLYFPGLGLALWGRLTLGEMYNVSMSVGVQLHAGHRLVTAGPYAIVRHPMYAGIIMAAWGGLLLYRTWTCVFAAFVFLGLLVRAHREEQALAAEFGPEWDAYCRRAPAWIPRIRR